MGVIMSDLGNAVTGSGDVAEVAAELVRREYTSPSVVAWGTVEELTQGAAAMNADGFIGGYLNV